jgi:hypothetical protein
MFHTYVASVLSRCCVCFAMVFKLLLQVFFASVLDACFKCFIYLLLYVASVASEALFSLWVKSFWVSHRIFHVMSEGVFGY